MLSLVIWHRRNVSLAHKQPGGLRQGVLDQKIVDVGIEKLFGQRHIGVQHTLGQVHQGVGHRGGRSSDGVFARIAQLPRGVQRHRTRGPLVVDLRSAMMAHREKRED